MPVRAKFRCTEKADRASNWGKPGEPTTAGVTLSAVAGPENKPWSQCTPSGEIKMTIDNPQALNAFEVGKDYFVDFTPAEGEVAPC